jgi:hypothetical protein
MDLLRTPVFSVFLETRFAWALPGNAAIWQHSWQPWPSSGKNGKVEVEGVGRGRCGAGQGTGGVTVSNEWEKTRLRIKRLEVLLNIGAEILREPGVRHTAQPYGVEHFLTEVEVLLPAAPENKLDGPD